MKHHTEFNFTHTLTQYVDDREVDEESIDLTIVVKACLDATPGYEGLECSSRIYDKTGEQDLTDVIRFFNKEFSMELEYLIDEEVNKNMAEALCEWRNEGLI